MLQQVRAAHELLLRQDVTGGAVLKTSNAFALPVNADALLQSAAIEMLNERLNSSHDHDGWILLAIIVQPRIHSFVVSWR
jgi:hypothetical protein